MVDGYGGKKMNERKDLLLALEHMVKTNDINLNDPEIKPNYAELARRWGCDYRTVKRAIEKIKNGGDEDDSEKIHKSKLDQFKPIIDRKLAFCCHALHIYNFLKKEKGYKGSYGLVKNYVRGWKERIHFLAVVRFETNPGLQVQIDWKESIKLITKSGQTIKFNVFLAILDYSRYKFLCVTETRDYSTVQDCIIKAINFFWRCFKRMAIW